MMRTLSHHQLQRPGRRRPAVRRGERGVIVVLVALSMVSIALVATVVIDGSQAYSQRRSMQNAADLASLAGARALDKARFGGGTWQQVSSIATSVAADNGAEASECTVINNTGGTIGPCSSQTAVLSTSAAGVRVRASDDRTTTFTELAGREKVTARASAAATIQKLKGTGTPFAICGDPAKGGYPILNPDGTINAATATAMGVVPIQGSQVPTCGAGSAFKGKIGDSEVIVPGWSEGDNGNGYEQEIFAEVIGATPCPSGGPFNNCDMLIPIANDGNGNGNSIDVYTVAWGIFHITGDGHGNPKYYASFRADVRYVSGGHTSNEVPADGVTPRVIRLIE